MLNLKLALGALAAEIASWSSLWLLRSQSDAALLGYLMAHGLASGLLALCLAPFLATSARSVRQRLALVALMGLFAYAVPVAGILGAVVATIALHTQRGPRGGQRFPVMPLPDFDPHQQSGTSRRQAGLQSFLANPNVPVASRMRAMVALGSVPGASAVRACPPVRGRCALRAARTAGGSGAHRPVCGAGLPGRGAGRCA
jgi:hypothetical protein